MTPKPIDSAVMPRLVSFVEVDLVCEAIDELYDAVDSALYYGHEKQFWPDIEALLLNPAWKKMPLTMLVAALVITRPVRGKLGLARPWIIELVRVHPETDGHENRFDRLISGLEEP